MHKNTDMIIWIFQDHIFIGHLTHLTNFHQYRVFATSRKKGRYYGSLYDITGLPTSYIFNTMSNSKKFYQFLYFSSFGAIYYSLKTHFINLKSLELFYCFENFTSHLWY